jgi:AcrR family transcriptional regulator
VFRDHADSFESCAIMTLLTMEKSVRTCEEAEISRAGQAHAPNRRSSQTRHPRRRRSLVSHTGPGSLRLQDVAAEVGLTRPNILHHFGSPERLMRGLNERILGDLRQRLSARLGRYDRPPPDIVARLLASVFTVFRCGLAKRRVWRGAAPMPRRQMIRLRRFSPVLSNGMHKHRLSVLPGDPPPRRANTGMLVYLVAVTALSDAVFGADLLRTLPALKRKVLRKNSAPGYPGSGSFISSHTKRPAVTPSHVPHTQRHAHLA